MNPPAASGGEWPRKKIIQLAKFRLDRLEA